MSDKTINQHIENNIEELDNPSTNSQRKRHLADELSMLQQYKINHPNEEKDPTGLELYCDSHPDSLECRVYED